MTNITKEKFERWWIDEIMEKFQLFNIKHHWMPNAIGMWPNECECFLWCAMNAPEGDWLEIGSFCGGSAVLLNLLENPYGSINCVDIEFNNVFYHNVHSTGRFYDTVLLECDSTTLRQHYNGHKISFAFIDGYHSYTQVLKDFQQLQKYTIEGSIIAFHDVSPKMWDEEYREELQKNSYYFDESCINVHEDFRLDEAVADILATKKDWEWLDIPVKNDETHFEETHLKEWIRGKTSPFTSLCAIRKIVQ